MIFGILKKIIFIVLFNLISLHVPNLNWDNLCALINNGIPKFTVVSSNASNIHIINWQSVLLKMLHDISFFKNIKDESLLLVNILKNNTNGELQISKITSLLIQCITDNIKRYSVIDIEELYSTYRKLGTSLENNSNSYNFAMKIANYLQADYILYGIVYGCPERPDLELQLILVNTGEILTVISSHTS